MPVQATAVTRFGIGGGIWNRLGGDYSGKEEGVAEAAPTIPFIGGVRIQPRLANVRKYKKKIKFKSDTKSFDVEEPPIEVSDTSFGLSQEVSRFERASDKLQGQLDLVQSEIKLFQAREDLESQLRAEFLIEETIKAASFIDGLLLQIIELRLIKRKREEEEIILLLLINQ